MIEEADLDQHRGHRRAEQDVVRVLAHAAIALGAAQRPQLALDVGRELGRLPLRRAALEIVEDQRGLVKIDRAGADSASA